MIDIFATNQSFEFGETIYPSGGQYGPLSSQHMDVSVLLEGHAEVIVDNVTYQINAGYTCFYYSSQSIEFRYSSDVKSHVLWCSTGQFIPPLEMIEGFRELPVSMLAIDTIINILRMGIALGAGDEDDLSRKRYSLGKLAFNAYFYQAHVLESEKPLPEKVVLAKKYIEENYTNISDLKVLAKEVELNPTYLLRLFKQHIGYTPTQYMWMLRAEKGVHLLTNSGLMISEVAYQCGFKTPFHFTNHIKKHYGCSPSELRKNVWYRDASKYLKQADIVKY